MVLELHHFDSELGSLVFGSTVFSQGRGRKEELLAFRGSPFLPAKPNSKIYT